jgi:hypothetical protein
MNVPLIQHELPAENEAVRDALYRGVVFQLPPNEASRSLVASVNERLDAELGRPAREAQFRFSEDEFFERVGRLRREFYLEPPFHSAVTRLITSLGFDPRQTAFDPARLRVISHRGFENPAAKAVYYAHRDTWYSHPQCQITWWIPLHDASPDETFVFFPKYFQRPVPNDSDVFDYDEWIRNGWSLKIGWQNKESGLTARYPGVTGEVDLASRVGFSCRSGEVLLFAGSHFHQTNQNTTGRTRFSLDFRTADRRDVEASRGAPNVDNRSRGSVFCDYVELHNAPFP